MTATEMHDLLALAFADIAKRPLFEAGTSQGFTHIKYCRFCSYSQSHVTEHGHDKDCLHARLEAAVNGSG